MAAKLGLPLYTVACHDDLTAADLVGRHLIGDGGTFWCDGPLTRAVREGGICYLDEVVEARKDTTVVLHPLADDRRILPIERTGETAASAGRLHAGRLLQPRLPEPAQGPEAVDPPALRRAALRFSRRRARRGHPASAKPAATPMLAKRLVSIGRSLRALKDLDLEEVASTRLLVYAATLIRDGIDAARRLPRRAGRGLTDDGEVAEALMEVVSATFGR